MKIFTIGFAKKTAEEFFEILREARIKRLVDVRLHNRSQLAGFTKIQDLPFFLTTIIGAEYVHEPLLAPDERLLKSYRKGELTWDEYALAFLELIKERQIERRLDPASFRIPTVLLCSEVSADTCHRRLVAEYLQRHWDDVTIVHL